MRKCYYIERKFLQYLDEEKFIVNGVIYRYERDSLIFTFNRNEWEERKCQIRTKD